MSNKPITVDEILEKWVEDAMSTSIFGISPIDGYKGITDEKTMDSEREADYDKYLAEAKAQLKEAVLSCVPEEQEIFGVGEGSYEKRGHNECRNETLKALDSLFGGSNE